MLVLPYIDLNTPWLSFAKKTLKEWNSGEKYIAMNISDKYLFSQHLQIIKGHLIQDIYKGNLQILFLKSHMTELKSNGQKILRQHTNIQLAWEKVLDIISPQEITH